MKFKRQSSAPIPTKHGVFETIAYSKNEVDPMPELVLLNMDTDFSKPVNVRIHSECMTGDTFGSYRCECGEQLDKALEYISTNQGLVIYLRQEGRGIGLINKLHAYTKQDEGYDTAEANKVLGFGYDDRTYENAIAILNDLGISDINLITNNPSKIEFLEQGNIKVHQRVSIEIQPRDENLDYLKTKRKKFGHMLDV